MSISKEPKAAPKKGGHHHWDYLPVENGKSEVAYLAGPTCGVYVHDGQPSKPCRREMTDSELVCPYCETGDEPRWKGYVPLYDRDYQRRLLLISQGVRESVKEINHLDQVRCSRAKSSKASVIIRAETWTPKQCPRGDGRDVPADIEPVLFTIWKDAVLREWWVRKEMEKISVQPVVVSDKPVSLPPKQKPPRKPAPAPTPPSAEMTMAEMYPGLAGFGRPPSTEPASMTPSLEATEAALKRRGKISPSLNGKHKTVPPKG